MKISNIIFNENSKSKSFIDRPPKNNNTYTTNPPTQKIINGLKLNLLY